MEIRKILVSQPNPANIEKSPFYEIAKKFKATVTYRPFIRIEGVTLKEFRSQRVEILEHSAIIFTSRTTIDNFFRICEEARINIPESMKYFCNTEAIALYLQKHIVYRKRKIFFANGQFNNFMELIIKHKNERFVLTLSEPHNPEIPLTLERLKLNFAKVIFAKTVSNDLSDLKLSDYDLLAFYSPSEITALVSTFGNEGLPLLATFGESTAKTANEAGLTLSTMAPSPTAPSMVKAVENLLCLVKAGKEIEPVIFSHSRKAEEFIKAQEAKPVKRTRKRKPVVVPEKTPLAKRAKKVLS